MIILIGLFKETNNEEAKQNERNKLIECERKQQKCQGFNCRDRLKSMTLYIHRHVSEHSKNHTHANAAGQKTEESGKKLSINSKAHPPTTNTYNLKTKKKILEW